MSDSVEIHVTADISELKSQLAEAQANVKQFSAAVDSLTAAAKTYGSQASIEAQLQKDQAALDEARSKVNQLASDIKTIEAPAQQAAAAVEGIAPAAGHGRTATAGMAREFIVLGHEVVSGNLTWHKMGDQPQTFWAANVAKRDLNHSSISDADSSTTDAEPS